MIEYDIWKVTTDHRDYSGTKFYESEKQFLKYGLPRTKSKHYNRKAWRFTSEGWKEVK